MNHDAKPTWVKSGITIEERPLLEDLIKTKRLSLEKRDYYRSLVILKKQCLQGEKKWEILSGMGFCGNKRDNAERQGKRVVGNNSANIILLIVFLDVDHDRQ